MEEEQKRRKKGRSEERKAPAYDTGREPLGRPVLPKVCTTLYHLSYHKYDTDYCLVNQLRT